MAPFVVGGRQAVAASIVVQSATVPEPIPAVRQRRQATFPDSSRLLTGTPPHHYDAFKMKPNAQPPVAEQLAPTGASAPSWLVRRSITGLPTPQRCWRGSLADEPHLPHANTRTLGETEAHASVFCMSRQSGSQSHRPLDRSSDIPGNGETTMLITIDGTAQPRPGPPSWPRRSSAASAPRRWTMAGAEK